METIGEKLVALRASKDVSLRKVASVGGWSGASSVQRYFEPEYDVSIRPETADRLAKSLGPEVYEISGTIEGPEQVQGIKDVLAILRNDTIPAEIRAAAAAEKLSRLL